MMAAPTKTITLADFLDGLDYAVMLLGDSNTDQFHAIATNDELTSTDGDTPEDALQALAEATCGPDTLLDIGRSEKWQQAHGPEDWWTQFGIDLADGEAGVIVRRGGALVLVEKRCEDVPGCVNLDPTKIGHVAGAARFCGFAIGGTMDRASGEVTVDHVAVCRPQDAVNPETGSAGPYLNTFPTGLPLFYPEHPADPPPLDPNAIATSLLAHVDRCREDGLPPGTPPYEKENRGVPPIYELCYAPAPQGAWQDTLDRITAWAAEHAPGANLVQHHTASGFFVQLQREGSRDEAQIYYDLTRLTPGAFSRQVDEMLAEWEKLLGEPQAVDAEAPAGREVRPIETSL